MAPDASPPEPAKSTGSPGSQGPPWRLRNVVLALSAVAILAGLWRAASTDAPPPATTSEAPAASAPEPPSAATASWDEMARSEDLLLALQLQVDDLAFEVQNLELPGKRGQRLFWPFGIEIADVAALEPAGVDGGAAAPLAPKTLGVTVLQANLAAPEVSLWRPLLEDVDYFLNASFKVKKGHFVAGAPDRFDTLVNFAGLARTQSGEWSWIQNRQRVLWRQVVGANPSKGESWRIVSWRMEGATTFVDTPALLFRDVLDVSLPDETQRSRARTSMHELYVAAHLKANMEGDPFEKPHPDFSHPANDRHPGLAVVDLDRDGFDDIYLMARWGRNQFFRNRGDGSFEEIAAELGIDVEAHSTSAVFADFDNDGDADLFLGRSLERSAYFENVDGHFVDRSKHRIDEPLPYFASSVNAVDVDRDGLLDVYISTYAVRTVTRGDLKDFLDPRDTDAFMATVLAGELSEYTQFPGPPNVLLHNAGGGRFEVVRPSTALQSFRNTYQATWADFDGDGDPDVYLANDFAPDALIRNDGVAGFVEVTAEQGITHFGLGMGATWGDYDRDGHQDLFVTNMYSSAGSRITEQLDYLDPRFASSAEGNFLYRNEAGTFRKVSGSGEDQIAVHKSGWSWGGQFADLDNDALLDLVVPNGFYTAPREVAIAGDT